MDPVIVAISVALVWSVAVVIPGPNFFITVQTAISKSRGSALVVVSGICVGTVIWAVSGFFGIAVLFNTVPWVYFVLKLVGGLYLIYLGVRLLMHKSNRRKQVLAESSVVIAPMQSFRLGLFTNLSNPKTAAFVTSLMVATMPSNVSPWLGFVCIFLMAAISCGWYTLVAFVFSFQTFRKVYQRFMRWIEGLAGIVFAGFGVKLVVSD
jgi:RhtB (resistance to homoserine/threonine) family protein